LVNNFAVDREAFKNGDMSDYEKRQFIYDKTRAENLSAPVSDYQT